MRCQRPPQSCLAATPRSIRPSSIKLRFFMRISPRRWPPLGTHTRRPRPPTPARSLARWEQLTAPARSLLGGGGATPALLGRAAHRRQWWCSRHCRERPLVWSSAAAASRYPRRPPLPPLSTTSTKLYCASLQCTCPVYARGLISAHRCQELDPRCFGGAGPADSRQRDQKHARRQPHGQRCRFWRLAERRHLLAGNGEPREPHAQPEPADRKSTRLHPGG